jgi:predicted NBD/HSP70 family sugar kinase
MLGSLARADFNFDPASDSVEQVLERVGSELGMLLARAGIERSSVLGAGVGISATVDPSSGEVLYAPLIGWPDQLPLGAILAEQLQMPVYIENGARSVVFAEALERPRHKLSSLATLMIGHALGAGIMLNGDLYQGFTNSAGLWAHMCIVPGGRLCRCGNQGCLDAYVGAPGIISTYRELGAGAALPEGDEYAAIAVLVERARAGKQQAADALRQTAAFLGLGVANFFNLIDPELVVIGGRTGTMIAEYLIDDLRKDVARRIHLKPFDPSRITVSALGVAALTKGPAALVLERFLQSSDSPSEARSKQAR